MDQRPGRLNVPLAREEAERLAAIRIEIGAVAETGSSLEVILNGRSVGQFQIDRAPWSETLDVSHVRIKGRLARIIHKLS